MAPAVKPIATLTAEVAIFEGTATYSATAQDMLPRCRPSVGYTGGAAHHFVADHEHQLPPQARLEAGAPAERVLGVRECPTACTSPAEPVSTSS